jgi:DNA modification methylase
MTCVQSLNNLVVNGNVIDIIKHVPDGSMDLTFTSPPYYNARSYSYYTSYIEYMDFLETVFLETHRVTKTGRFLAVNTSPVIVEREKRSKQSKRYGIPFDLHCRIVKSGFDFMEDIVWIKPEASVKNRIGGFMQHCNPLAYKPNIVTEYVMVYRKHTERLIDWNIHQYDREIITKSKVHDGYENTNTWKISPFSTKKHPAVFPLKLAENIIRYYSYWGDLIFDPFAGIGTTGHAANNLGRIFFMTEVNEGFFHEIKKSFRTPQTCDFMGNPSFHVDF